METTRTIRKYANRKLYDTATSTYVSLSDIIDMIKDGDKIKVLDHVSKADVTGEVMLAAFVTNQSGKNVETLLLETLIKNS